MEEIEVLYQYLFEMIGKLSPNETEEVTDLSGQLVSSLNADLLKLISVSISDYIRNPDINDRLNKCLLGSEGKKNLMNIFDQVADRYIGSPDNQPPQNFTVMLQEALQYDYTVKEQNKIIETLDFNRLEAFIRHHSFSHAERYQDILGLLQNAIWVTDRLLQVQSAPHFEYPYSSEIQQFIKLLHSDGFSDSKITLELLNDAVPEVQPSAQDVDLSGIDVNAVLISAIKDLEQNPNASKGVLKKLKALSTTNKLLDDYTFADLMALDYAVNANINTVTKKQLVLVQHYVWEQFRDNLGFNQVKTLLTIAPGNSWAQLATDPQQIFTKIDPFALFYITIVLGSKASEDRGLSSTYYAERSEVYRTPGQEGFQSYKALRSETNALEKFIVTLLDNDLSLDRSKMSPETQDFFAEMRFAPHHKKFGL